MKITAIYCRWGQTLICLIHESICRVPSPFLRRFQTWLLIRPSYSNTIKAQWIFETGIWSSGSEEAHWTHPNLTVDLRRTSVHVICEQTRSNRTQIKFSFLPRNIFVKNIDPCHECNFQHRSLELNSGGQSAHLQSAVHRAQRVSDTPIDNKQTEKSALYGIKYEVRGADAVKEMLILWSWQQLMDGRVRWRREVSLR